MARAPSEPIAKLSIDASETGRIKEEAVWDQFSELIDTLTELASNKPTTEAFYTELLAGAVSGFAATAGRAWVPDAESGWRLLHQVGSPPQEKDLDSHERLLSEASQATRPLTRSTGADAVTIVRVVSAQNPSVQLALIELVQRTGCAEELYRSTERLLEAIAHIAAEYHDRLSRTDLEQEIRFHREVLSLASHVAGDLRIGPTASRSVNACRRLLSYDRVSLVRTDGRCPKHLATSGVDRADTRTEPVHNLEWIARVTAGEGRPLAWSADGQIDLASQFTEESLARLDRYADTNHVRMLVAAPLYTTGPVEESSAATEDSEPVLLAVMIAESFTAHSDRATPEQIAIAGQACAPALSAALNCPLAGVQRWLGKSLRLSRVVGLLVAIAAIAGLVAAAVLVEVEHTVTLRGTVQPNVQRELYAPADALVERTDVVGGDRVEQRSVLLQLQDSRSLNELQRLEGELFAVERQHDAVAASRVSLDRGNTPPSESLRLAADEKRLLLRAESLRAELELIRNERRLLTVTSPIAGVVTTWQLNDLLAGRPVERGQRLLTVVDDSAGWMIELEAPDNRIGLLQKAEHDLGEPLHVEFTLASDPTKRLQGRIQKMAQRAEAHSADPVAGRIVRIEVAPDEVVATNPDSAATPLVGVTVRAEVHCGQRSVAYIALHDVWNYLTTRWELGW